jgi:hypothetical protein
MPAVRAAEPGQADLSDKQAFPAGEASLAAGPEEATEVASVHAALVAAYACVLAEPIEEEEDTELPL